MEKSVAALLRRSSGGTDLLVFRHPLAGVQIPKGTIEPNETPAACARRELMEETGVGSVTPPTGIGQWERPLPGGRSHVWHVFVMEPLEPLPQTWKHDPFGSAAEVGMTFRLFWMPVDPSLSASLHPLFAPVSSMLLEHVGG